MTTRIGPDLFEFEDYDPEDIAPACPTCGSSQEWERCWSCGGEGEHDVYEEDPLWYDPGDTERCSECHGEGGWWWCWNVSQHPQEGQRDG